MNATPRDASRALNIEAEILVIGGGPAGMAAATAAAGPARQPGLRNPGPQVLLVDNAIETGGQIWRSGVDYGGRPEPEAQHARAALESSGAQFHGGWRIVDAPSPGVLLALREAAPLPETTGASDKPQPGAQVARFHYKSLVLATGARERLLPFPGWTLPGVFGAGGLQALVKGGYDVRNKRIVVSGTGPLLLAVAAHLVERGARLVCVAEQAPLSRLAPFAASLWAQPRKALQGLRYRATLGRTSLHTGCWVTEAVSAEPSSARPALQGVLLTNGTRTWEVPCDLLATGYHLVPNTELPALLGCKLRQGFVAVDAQQQTSVPGIFCAGEPTGIAGLDAALISGRVAGLAAAGLLQAAMGLSRRNQRGRAFGQRLDRAFALRGELKSLGHANTIVCRCEDVRLAQLGAYSSWTEAKLQTRCGMGPCQGRVCGPALEAIFGWQPASVRPPLFPMPISAWSAIGSDAPLLSPSTPHNTQGDPHAMVRSSARDNHSLPPQP